MPFNFGLSITLPSQLEIFLYLALIATPIFFLRSRRWCTTTTATGHLRTSRIRPAWDSGAGYIAISDFDRDGKIDLAIANDSMPQFLYHNNGDGMFEEQGFTAEIAVDLHTALTRVWALLFRTSTTMV